ncbi:MAG TPA: flagellin [Lachnospiraceae bacterium]|nr:flagellin [Lachnospiraceae bacterium]
MVVQHNMQAANANRMLGMNVKAVAKNTEKLSSGYKVNRAADDAAGLSISEKMRNQIRGINQAVSNSEDGQYLIQTAEGNLNEIHSILQRMGELATKGANEVNATDDRKAIADELTQLTEEIDSISKKAQFNGKYLLSKEMNPNISKGISLQVGANKTETMTVQLKEINSSQLGLSDLKTKAVLGSNYADGLSTGTSKYRNLMSTVTTAVKTVSDTRSQLGAIQNRLDYTINNLENYSENLTSSESNIRDTDMATEMVNYSKNNILQQAAQSMLAQANQSNQGVLSLLQ